MSMTWGSMDRRREIAGIVLARYDDATEWAELQQPPVVDGSAWRGLAMALLIEAGILRLAMLLYGWLR